VCQPSVGTDGPAHRNPHSYSDALNVFGGGGPLLILSIIGLIITVIIAVFAILAMYNAYTYKAYHVPVLGNLADKFMSKANGPQ